MRKFILTFILMVSTLTAFAQYASQPVQINTTNTETVDYFTQQNLNDYELYRRGQRQVASGGIMITSTMVFSGAYFGITANALKAPVSGFKNAKATYAVGGVITAAGVIGSLYLFIRGYSNMQRFDHRFYMKPDGTMCIPFGK